MATGTGIYIPTNMLGDGTASSAYVLGGNQTWLAIATLAVDHGGLVGLSDDDHSQYALLAGRASGQTLKGDTASGGNLTLMSTAHATKGKIVVGSKFAIDETTGCTAFGHTSPSSDYGVDIQDASFSVAASSEEGLYFRRWGSLGVSTNPLFMLGRIIGNAYGAEFRIIYYGDEVGGSPERTIFTCESTGTLAMVKQSGEYGSYYEGFTAGDVKPYFRINTYQPGFTSPSPGIEFGPGGSTEADVAWVRFGAGYMSLTRGQAASKIGGAIEFTLWDTSTTTNEPSATPGGNQAFLFLREDGSGNGQLRAKFPSGSTQIIAYEGGGDLHSIYALLAGRSGGQSLTGGTGSGDDLTLLSTSHGTKGTIFFGTASAYDQVNDRLGIGVTTPGNKLVVNANHATAYAVVIDNDGNNANRYGVSIQCGEDTPAGNATFIDMFEGDGAATGAIYANGAGVMQYADVSDINHKKDILPTSINGLQTVDGLQLIEYSRVKHKGTPNEHTYRKTPIGFSAQNCQTVFPFMVGQAKDGSLMVAPNSLIPVLVKAIQELHTEVNDLKLKVK